MSQGYIKNGITHIVTGPLVGMERRIRKIDRHKRLANIEMPMQGMENLCRQALRSLPKLRQDCLEQTRRSELFSVVSAMGDGDFCNIRMHASPEFLFFLKLRIWRSIPQKGVYICGM